MAQRQVTLPTGKLAGRNEYQYDNPVITALRPYKTTIAAGASGILGTFVGYPFDCLKTRMQTSEFPSMNTCAKVMYQEEGMGAFYRGIISPLISTTCLRAFTFTVYDTFKRNLVNKLLILPEEHRLQQKISFEEYSSKNFLSTLPFVFVAGVSGGSASSIPCIPLELVKVQMQLQRVIALSSGSTGNLVHETTLSCTRRIVREYGFSALYRGATLHLLRDGIGMGFYFGFYESLKHLVTIQLGISGSPLVYMLAGGCSGTMSWFIGFPVDLIKSRIQKEAFLKEKTYASGLDCFRKVIAQSGIRGLYSGMVPTLVRAFPIHSINFLVYESVLKIFS
ncbi:mitochondrial carrier [Basidiobolus meristosporus CBS 931.73]|uniref:Mitochondrial carrier n=1 Tax=Basidiobolus meristosporus CBS 931.73 TaxID=1314790 RepID=A0A1Y1Z1C6_9FUNG|nr:mitochondrial carrier [Basidiobolus meristosporus CBS 931.73]|eukprot:ORY04092.1 mitochondrial carrier [Basidiobolus meristosporus CBS 931.73]